MGESGPTPRLEGLDVLRGFALMALFIVHMPELFEPYWANGQDSVPAVASNHRHISQPTTAPASAGALK